MKIVWTTLFITVVALVFSGGPSPAEAEGSDDLLIIVNNSTKAKTISADEIRAIFLKKKASAFGNKIKPINAKENSRLRKAFRKRLLGMTEDEEKAYWEEQKVKKGNTNPTEFGNTLKAVFSVKGSISYCFRSDFKPGAAKIVAEF